jgi:UDP-GlcNAc:undecaprenyl-phosphate GlcNAc-1-phosphate transferase
LNQEASDLVQERLESWRSICCGAKTPKGEAMICTWSCTLGLTITVAVLLILIPVARRLGLVDWPGGRKCHEGPVPLIGGIAMFWGFLFAVLTLDVPLAGLRGLLEGTALLVFVGLLDDLHELSSRARFLAQIGAALMMVYLGDVRLSDLGHLTSGGAFTLGAWEVPFTVFATVGVINAVNLTDGLDGLAGTLTLVALGALASLASAAGRTTDAVVLLGLVGAVLAFLALNLRLARLRALVFMGDAGSMFLGFAVAWFCISLSQGSRAAMSPVTALWIFALPLFDTVSLMLRRMLGGRSPFSADRDHLHYILLAAGCSVNQSVAAIGAAALTLAGIGVAGHYLRVPESLMFLSLMGLFVLYFWGVMYARRAMRVVQPEKSLIGVTEMLLEGRSQSPGGS